MHTMSLETLQALAEVPSEVLRELKELPVEVLQALREVPPETLRSLRSAGMEKPPSSSGVGWTGVPENDELKRAIDHVNEVMERSNLNIVGAFGQYRPKGWGWWNVYISTVDDHSGGVDAILNTPDYKTAQALAVLGSEVRLAILRSLFDAPKSVAELVADLRMGTTGQAYHHLRELERAGAVEAREGKYHFNYPAYTRI
jgi:DNA-binding HxlR family transcriptional regulator